MTEALPGRRRLSMPTTSIPSDPSALVHLCSCHSGHGDLFIAPQPGRGAALTRPPHGLFPWAQMPFLQESIGFTPSPPSKLHSQITFPRRPNQTTLHKNATLYPPPALIIPYLALYIFVFTRAVTIF